MMRKSLTTSIDTCVVYFAGPMGSGKSTSARLIQSPLSMLLGEDNCTIVSFAEAVRKEVSERMGIPIELTRTQEGKLAKLDDVVPDWEHKKETVMAVLEKSPTTVREALQMWGMYRRSIDPNYWVNRTLESIYNIAYMGCRAIIVDDVRFGNEATALKRIACWDRRKSRILHTLGVHYLGVAQPPYDPMVMMPVCSTYSRQSNLHISEWAIKSSDFNRLFDLTCTPEFGNLSSYVWLAVDMLIQKLEQRRR